MRLSSALAAVAAASLVALAGCSGSSSGAAPRAGASPTGVVPSPGGCPSVAASTTPQWPAEIPADLPRPDGATIVKSQKTSGNLTVVQFTTKHSLEQAVRFVVAEFPKSGYVLGRGEMEAVEADAPFGRGPLTGLMRMFVVKECETLWMLAIGQRGAGVPFNLNYTPNPSASALPFG